MPLRNLVAAIHPRLAVVLHDLLMVWIAWIAVSMLRWSLEPNPLPVDAVQAGSVDRAGGAGRDLLLDRPLQGPLAFRQPAGFVEHRQPRVLGALAIAIALFLYNRLSTVPRSVLTVYPLVLCGAARRAASALSVLERQPPRFAAAAPSQRVLVLGAGRAGEALVRDLRRDNRYTPVGFLDDNAHLRGARVHGVPVLGTLDQLPELARETAAEMLLIAMPTREQGADAARGRSVRKRNLPFRTVPRLEDVVAGRAQFNEIKEVAIEDLLGRDPVELDWTAIRTQLAGRRVLVTGGGGSIGSELCRQIARLGAESLTVVDSVRIQPLPRSSRSCAREYPELLFNARARRLRRRGDMRAHVRIDAAAGGVPRRGLQARAAAAGDNCAKRSATTCSAPRWSPMRPIGIGVGQFRADLHRQGGQSDQRDGRLQARRRDLLPELRERSRARVSSPCVSATCWIRPARWCRCFASRSAPAVR